MPIQYNPADTGVWKDGQYPATLQVVTDETSKKTGLPMQKWTWLVFDDASNRQITIDDYYVPPKGNFKLRQLASALNRASEFQQGTFQADDYVNYRVLLKLGVKESIEYGDKNVVESISAMPGQQTAPQASQSPQRPRQQPVASNVGYDPANEIKGEDIPF